MTLVLVLLAAAVVVVCRYRWSCPTLVGARGGGEATVVASAGAGDGVVVVVLVLGVACHLTFLPVGRGHSRQAAMLAETDERGS